VLFQHLEARRIKMSDRIEIAKQLQESQARKLVLEKTKGEILLSITEEDAGSDLEAAKNDLVKVVMAEGDISKKIAELLTELTLCKDLELEVKEDFYDSFTEPPRNAFARDHTPQNRNSPNSAPHRSGFKAIAKPQTFKSGDDIGLFFERFKNFVILSEAYYSDLSLLLLNYVQDNKMYRTLKAVKLTQSQKADIDELITAYESHLFPATETRLLRSTLSSIRQKAEESVKDFAIRIEEISSRAFTSTELKEEGSLQSFLSGLSDTRIRRKLMEADVTTFEQATRMATKINRISEAIGGSQEDSTTEIDLHDVLRVDNRQPHTAASATRQMHPADFSGNQRNTGNTSSCFICGASDHRFRSCPSYAAPHPQSNGQQARSGANRAANITCFGCGIRGHYASDCPSGSQPGPNARPRHQVPREPYRRPLMGQPTGSVPASVPFPPTGSTTAPAPLNANSTGFLVHPSRT